MSPLAKTLEIRTSPHVLSGHAVDTIMFNVVLALLPASAFAVWAFGLAGLLTLTVAVLSCVATEWWMCRLSRRVSTVADWSAVITGLLYGLTLPPTLPLWMTALGGFLAIAAGKWLFGGLGYNAFNPALVGRALLQASFPVAMTTWSAGFLPDRFRAVPAVLWTPPFLEPVLDATTGATPLAAWKFERVAASARDLAFGFTSGSTGETSALLILFGGAYLVARNMMNWRIPVALLLTVGAISGVLHAVDPTRYASAPFMLLAGGLALGATFMATDMVASPMTSLGCVIYGVLIGALVIVIRTWGGMPEGVMYAILLGNAVSPQIDALIRPRVYGTRRARTS
ncbi:MAG: RnfABCDGE type electron transport complex subunit D [bacterium]